MEGKRPIGIDLFCGAGGMSLGFEQAGFDVVAAVDSDPVHVATHRNNFPDCETIQADLSELSGATLRSKTDLGNRQIDVLFGGPPCGGFSLMGKRDSKDPRNELLEHFARLIAELKPRYFVVENVEGLLIDPMAERIEAFKTRTAEDGYSIVDPIQILDASDFGVPQRRKRIFILGYEKGPAPEYPTSPFDDDGDLQHTTVWDAIGDLPDVNDLIEVLKGDVYDGELPFTESRYARILRGEVKDPEDLSLLRKRNGNGLTGCGWIDHTPEVVQRFAATEPGTREPISKFYRLSKE